VNIDSILDGIKSLGKLVDDTDVKVEESMLFVKNYSFFENVNIALDFSKEVVANYIELIMDDKSDFYTLDDINDENLWSKWFIKKEKLFATDKKVTVEFSTKDNAFLTIEAVNELSPYKEDGVYEFKKIDAASEISEKTKQSYPGVLIPLSDIKKIAAQIGEAISFNIDEVDINCSFSEGQLLQISSGVLLLRGFNFNQTVLLSRFIKSTKGKLNLSSLNSVYLLKNGKIKSNALIPESASTNVATFKDLIDTDFIKSGKPALLILKSEPDEDTLTNEINNHFENNESEIEFENNYIVTKDTYQSIVSQILGQYVTI